MTPHRCKPYDIIRGQRIQPEKLRIAQEFRREMTPGEKTLWQALHGNRLAGFHFRRQQNIDGYLVDFYCHKAGLVIEVDGGIHEEPDQHAYDEERDCNLAARGLAILRIPEAAVLHDTSTVLNQIHAAILDCLKNHDDDSTDNTA